MEHLQSIGRCTQLIDPLFMFFFIFSNLFGSGKLNASRIVGSEDRPSRLARRLAPESIETSFGKNSTVVDVGNVSLKLILNNDDLC